MTERVCQRPGCGKSIEHLRADARYCDSICRREASRQRASQPAGTRPFNWTGYRAARRTRPEVRS